MPATFGDPTLTIAEDMRRIPREHRKHARPKLRQAAEVVAADTRRRSGWSTRIPGTVRVATSFRVEREGVSVHSGGPSAPHARPYEGISRDPFRVPLFGDRDHWYPRAARPSLFPSAKANEAEATALMHQALGETAQGLGFT